jgi:hypothetical protein
MPEKNSLQTLEPEEVRKGELIKEYLKMYAVIDGRVITEETFRVFLLALDHYDYRKLEKGLKRYLQKGTRFPWPGLLAEFIDEEV